MQIAAAAPERHVEIAHRHDSIGKYTVCSSCRFGGDLELGGSVRAGGKRIIHVHISENDRSTPGEGHVHWDESFQTLAEIGYDGWLMIEAFGTALPETGVNATLM